MKYDKDTMNSLQEAYDSVNEGMYKGGKFIKPKTNPKTGLPLYKQDKTKKTKEKKQKGPNYEASTAGSDIRDIDEAKVDKIYSRKKNYRGIDQLTQKRNERNATPGENRDIDRKTFITREPGEPETVARGRARQQYSDQERGKKKQKGSKTRDAKGRTLGQSEYLYNKKKSISDRKTLNRIFKNKSSKGHSPLEEEAYEIVSKKRLEKAINESRKEYINQVDKKKEMEDKMKEVEDMRSLPTRMNLIKTKLRAMGLNMSHQLKGKELSEVIDYTLNELNRYEKETGKSSGSLNMPKGTPTQKGGDTNPVMRKVRTNIRKETGKPEGQRKTRGKGEITPDMIGPSLKLQKKIDNVRSRRALDAKARKAGYKNTQDYVDVQAVRQGGLGT